MERAGSVRAMLCVVAMMPFAACHVYTPITLDAVAPGERVRVRLAGDAAGRLMVVAPNRHGVLEGTLAGSDAGTILLHLPTTSPQMGFPFEPLHQRIHIPAADVLEMEREELDRVRTGALVAGVTAAVALLALRVFDRGAGGTTVNPPPGGPSESVRP